MFGDQNIHKNKLHVPATNTQLCEIKHEVSDEEREQENSIARKRPSYGTFY